MYIYINILPTFYLIKSTCWITSLKAIAINKTHALCKRVFDTSSFFSFCNVYSLLVYIKKLWFLYPRFDIISTFTLLSNQAPPTLASPNNSDTLPVPQEKSATVVAVNRQPVNTPGPKLTPKNYFSQRPP
jgi:hypothetical protein